MGESDRVNERFKRRANLPVCRSERAIEFALSIIAAADQRANPAAGVVDHDNRALQIRHRRIAFSVLRWLVVCFQRMTEIGLLLDFREFRLERLLGGVLHGRIERGVDRQAPVIDLVLCQQSIQIPLNRIHRIILLDKRQTFGMRTDFRALCLFGLRGREFFQCHQAIQNSIALQGCAFRIF